MYRVTVELTHLVVPCSVSLESMSKTDGRYFIFIWIYKNLLYIYKYIFIFITFLFCIAAKKNCVNGQCVSKIFQNDP